MDLLIIIIYPLIHIFYMKWNWKEWDIIIIISKVYIPESKVYIPDFYIYDSIDRYKIGFFIPEFSLICIQIRENSMNSIQFYSHNLESI